MKTAAADLIVVGAGFAGLACARAAADAGLETLVLERKPWPGSKTHSTGIIVRELAESWPIPGRLCRRIEHIRLYSPSLRTLDLASPGYYFLATDTPALLRWHLRQATAAGGVSVRFATPFTDAGYKNGGWGVNDGTFHSRFLVGADGARSPVARALGLGRNRRFLLAIEVDLDPPRPSTRTACMYLSIADERRVISAGLCRVCGGPRSGWPAVTREHHPSAIFCVISPRVSIPVMQPAGVTAPI